MTLGKLFKEAGERIAAGETDLHRMAAEFTGRVLGDPVLTSSAVRQLVEKRLRDALSSHLKPAGLTARVPAGQIGWLVMEPTNAISRMRDYVRKVIKMKARADRHALVLGYIDGSGLQPADYATLGDLCLAAGVPEELVAALAA